MDSLFDLGLYVAIHLCIDQVSDRICKGVILKIFDLVQNTYPMHQDTLTVTEYFTELEFLLNER